MTDNKIARKAKSKRSVGYRSPPKDKQFKPGVSGNPSGRPKVRRSVRRSIMDAFIAPIKIRDGNEIKSIRRIDAIYLKQIEAALKGGGSADIPTDPVPSAADPASHSELP